MPYLAAAAEQPLADYEIEHLEECAIAAMESDPIDYVACNSV